MTLQYKQPAQFFEQSLPIGNGRIGALVYGGTDDCLLYLNDITLWTGSPVDQNEGQGCAEWIPQIREALFREDYKEADKLQKNVQGHSSAHYQPLGTLHIYDWNTGRTKRYQRQLSLDSALVSDSYERNGVTFRREYLASYPDSLIAIRLTASKPGELNFRLTLSAQVPHSVKASRQSAGGQLTMTGHATGDERHSVHFCTMLRVAETDGQLTATDGDGITLRHGTYATLYLVNATSYNGARRHPVTEGAPYLEKAADLTWHTANTNYDEVRRNHVADYKKYYDRVKLDLGGKPNTATTDKLLTEHANDRYLETLYFQFGRYLLISSSRTSGVPANLQGLWTPHLWSPWRGNYTININLEENYWPAFVANLAEMAMPLDGFITQLAENGRHSARNFYGVEEGWCASHNSDLWAMANPVGDKTGNPKWANWNMGGAWLVNTLWERFQYTQDIAYLRQTAFPLLKGAAEFCMAWLVEHNGELVTAPSTSPENNYVASNGYKGATCYGGTADLAIIRELLLNTRRAATLVGKEQRLILRINSTLARLHPYTIGQEGDLNEWYHDWKDSDPRHRHQSHLIGLYPGNHITADSLLNACEKTLIQKGDETTGWSTGWRINLWARLHNAKQAFHIYRKLLTFTDAQEDKREGTRHAGGTYANLFDAHPPFQIDGNFGGTAGVCEMLIQSTVTSQQPLAATIELLPACPEEWSNGSVSGLMARGGFEVSLDWQAGAVKRVTVKALKAGMVTLLCNGTKKSLQLKAGQSQTLQF